MCCDVSGLQRLTGLFRQFCSQESSPMVVTAPMMTDFWPGSMPTTRVDLEKGGTAPPVTKWPPPAGTSAGGGPPGLQQKGASFLAGSQLDPDGWLRQAKAT